MVPSLLSSAALETKSSAEVSGALKPHKCRMDGAREYASSCRANPVSGRWPTVKVQEEERQQAVEGHVGKRPGLHPVSAFKIKRSSFFWEPASGCILSLYGCAGVSNAVRGGCRRVGGPWLVLPGRKRFLSVRGRARIPRRKHLCLISGPETP